MSVALNEQEPARVAARVVDTRGSRCPLPLLGVRREIVHVGIGEVLELWVNDKRCRTIVRAWAKKARHDFLGFAADAGYDRIYVRRAR
jgi:TusA-related sulfurtransferase